MLNRKRHTTAVATTLVTYGANSRTRHSGFQRTVASLSSSAVPSDAPIAIGTPSPANSAVLPSARQNNGVENRPEKLPNPTKSSLDQSASA